MDILEMLTYRRPAGSDGEKAFIERFLMPLNPVKMAKNLVVVVPGGTGKTLFSCHTDTVHFNDSIQEVLFDQNLNLAYKSDKTPLGADNTAGVWLLGQMIKQEIPGTYVFHYGEEKGCIGSREMAGSFKAWLRGFDRAIAFDRRGRTSIITHQHGNRCCSETFAKAICEQLENYEPDATGLYTDTASYTHLIPECTNISVGYMHEHSSEESLDIEHLEWLEKHVGGVKWDELPTVRSCADKSARDSGRNYGTTSTWGDGYKRRVYCNGRWSDEDDVTPIPSYRNWRNGKPDPKAEDEAEDAAARAWARKQEELAAKEKDEDAEDEAATENAANIDWLCGAAVAEADSFARALDLCKNDSEYAATLLYALVCRELDYVQMEDVPAPKKTTPDMLGLTVLDELQDICAGIVEEEIAKLTKTIESRRPLRKPLTSQELWGIAL